MKKDINPRNDKFQLHGYQEWYWTKGELNHRGCRKNGKRIGYMEWHNTNFNCTKFYIR